MATKVLIAEPRGFCAGVEMAIKALTWMVKIFEPPVYCYHEIVHNAAVVEAFERAGVRFVDDIATVPAGAPVMLSAHGSAPEVVKHADRVAAVMVDAVCPLVTKVHHEIRKRADAGFDIIYVGHEGHDEAVGAVAEAPAAVTLVDPDDGLGDFTPNDTDRVALVAQTTLGLFEWEDVLGSATERYPGLWTARKSDLCYATTNRQTAVQELARQSDVVLVVGSENSSNTNALVRVARLTGSEAYRVDGPESVDPAWIEAADVVGITAGASAPEQRVREVIEAVSPGATAHPIAVTDEDEYFPLPASLRKLVVTLQALVEGAYGARTPGLPGPLDEDRSHGAAQSLEILGL